MYIVHAQWLHESNFFIHTIMSIACIKIVIPIVGMSYEIPASSWLDYNDSPSYDRGMIRLAPPELASC